ncbi:MAG TPA: glucosyl transferase [Bosea sp. (in: a-proteobacteria)]|uniref:glucosyl transferase n=1 Tax=Bosea sp. (in: a-proteobacteria) TaxID=1871050 RepID=UPI002E11919A|nr:glucosyl transferase [Bosea sp. (in: a-proteobacteria)]
MSVAPHLSIQAPLDSTLLVSLIVVCPDGFDNIEADLKRLIAEIRGRYAFFEVLIIGDAGDQSGQGLLRRLGPAAPQIRCLQIEGATDFDRLAMQGYLECIGDIVVLSSADELCVVDLMALIDRLRSGEELVRIRRRQASALEKASSFVVRLVTGLNVDIRFLRTLGVNRKLLSELLSRPEEIHLFRFTAHTLFPNQAVIDIDHAPKRGGLQLIARRIDLAARLVATSAPRLLRTASALCLALSVLAILALFYVVGVWLIRDEVAEGWTTMISMLALWMFAQLAATAVLCLGLSRLLDRQERSRMPRLVDELTVSDLFSTSGLLNIESADDVRERSALPQDHQERASPSTVKT